MGECFATTPTGEGNITRGTFLENTRYCDCLPLTEYDGEGNRKWKIDIAVQNGTCCKADYTCREGYKNSQNDRLVHRRVCHIQNASWNHTEPDCRKIDTSNRSSISSTALFISLPSALLVVIFFGMMLFVIWWRRRAKHHPSAIIEGNTKDERNATNIAHVKHCKESSEQLVMQERQYATTFFGKAKTDENEASSSTLNECRDFCSQNGTIETRFSSQIELKDCCIDNGATDTNVRF